MFSASNFPGRRSPMVEPRSSPFWRVRCWQGLCICAKEFRWQWGFQDYLGSGYFRLMTMAYLHVRLYPCHGQSLRLVKLLPGGCEPRSMAGKHHSKAVPAAAAWGADGCTPKWVPRLQWVETNASRVYSSCFLLFWSALSSVSVDLQQFFPSRTGGSLQTS